MPDDVPARVMKTFKELKGEKEGYIELKEVNGRYYVHRSTSVWDKEEKRPKKKSNYLGSINFEGEFKPKNPQGRRESKKEVFEYGNGKLAYYFLKEVHEELEKYTPHADELVAAAVIRAVDPKPLRLHESCWADLHLSRDLDVKMSAKHLSKILKATGEGVGWWHKLFQSLINEDDLLLYDLTTIFTQSKNIKLAEKGYNPDELYLDQIGIVLAFSKDTSLPTGIEIYWGSMKDITTIKDFLNRLNPENIGFILDRGFWSEPLLQKFQNQKISYIAPIRKNSKYMDPRWLRWKQPFTYRKRSIRWSRRNTELGSLYFFEDPKLKGEQESALLRKVENGKISMEEYEEKKKTAGLIGLITNLHKKDGKQVYDLYKGRQDVELAFDAMKNTLDADKTHLQSSEAVRGYFFVTFLALRVYFHILKRLREKELTEKISVKEVLYELSKIRKIIGPSGKETFAKTPKKARKIAQLFPKAEPMG